MILDESLFENARGVKPGVKRGPYNIVKKEKSPKINYNTIYDGLDNLGYTIFSMKDGIYTSKAIEKNLDKAKEFLDNLGVNYTVDFSGHPKKYYLNIKLSDNLVQEPKEDELMKESTFTTQDPKGNEIRYDVENDGTITVYEGDKVITKGKTNTEDAKKVFNELGFKEIVKEDLILDPTEEDKKLLNDLLNKYKGTEYERVLDQLKSKYEFEDTFGGKNEALKEDSSPLDPNQDIIIAKFKDGEDTHRIVKAANGKFFNEYSIIPTNNYNIFAPSSYAGPFDTEKEAEEMLLKHRPKAIKISNESLKEELSPENKPLKEHLPDNFDSLPKEERVKILTAENNRKKLLTAVNRIGELVNSKNPILKDDWKIIRNLLRDNNLLKEDLSQEEQKDFGLNTLINQLVKSEYDAIDEYNSAIVTLEAEGQGEYTDVIRSIIEDERHHIGNLQEIMNRITPGTEAEFEHGKEEAIETLDEEKPEDEFKTTIDTEKGVIKTYKLDNTEEIERIKDVELEDSALQG